MTTAIAAAEPTTYGIFRTVSSRPLNYVTPESHDEDMRAATLVTTEASYEDAVELAFMFAQEHAERLQVEAKRSGNFVRETGGSLVTNNGSWVWYSAKPLTQ